MKSIFPFLLLFLCSNSFGQEIVTDSTAMSYKMTVKKDGNCKLLIFDLSNNISWRDMIYYYPDGCSENTPVSNSEKYNFSDEMPYLKTLLDEAKQKGKLKLGFWLMDPTIYKDLRERIIYVFSHSAKWNAYLKHKDNIDEYKLIRSIFYDEKVFNEVEKFASGYGYHITEIALIKSELQMVPLKGIKSMLKGKKYRIPMPVELGIGFSK